ncbi:MAG: regulatory protein GemA [Sulfuricellaceae bacterium]
MIPDQSRNEKRLAASRKKIHVARRQLNMDDADYRALLRRAAGVESSADIRRLDRIDAVMAEFRRLGFKDVSARHGRAPNTLDREPQLQKIEALLADMKLSWKYAEAIARQQNPVAGDVRIERLEWVPTAKLKGIITALVIEQRKRALLASVDQLLAACGKTHDDVTARLCRDGGRAGNWRRRTSVLNGLINSIPQWWPA